MFKFIPPSGTVITFTQNIVEIDENLSPIKEILKKSDFSEYSFARDEDENSAISLSDIFQLQINVKNVGVFHFIFKNDGFKKEEVINQVAALKDVSANTSETAQHKVSALISILKNYDPLFAIFKESPNNLYYVYHLEDIVNNRFPVFIVKTEEETKVYEFFIGDDDFQESTKSSEKKQVFSKVSREKMTKDLLKNKFSLLLIFVSTVLLEVSIPLAILNIYAKNALYIFLFICGAIGIAMNAYCYIDYFKNRNIKNPLFIFSAIANLIGILTGIGVFAIFYNISTKVEGTPSIGSFILIGALVALIVIAATIAVVYFIPKKNKAK